MVSCVGTKILRLRKEIKGDIRHFACIASPFTDVSLELILTKTANVAIKNVKA